MNAPAALDVIGVGTNSADVVLRLPHLPGDSRALSKIRVIERSICMGGQTATALATCASLGLRTAYVGAIGSDDPGRRMRDELRNRGIDLDRAVERDAPNHYAHILVDDAGGGRIVLWGREPGLELQGDEIPFDLIRSARLLHVDDVDVRAAVCAGRIARGAGLTVTSDIDRADERLEELLASVTVPIFAEHVPELVAGVRDPERGLRLMRARHHGLLCVTLGEDGAMALDGDRVVYEPAFRVKAVDTTGAGDVFRGAFIYALLNGWSVGRILRFANAAAAVSCTRLGAMNGVPSAEEIDRMMAQAIG